MCFILFYMFILYSDSGNSIWIATLFSQVTNLSSKNGIHWEQFIKNGFTIFYISFRSYMLLCPTQHSFIWEPPLHVHFAVRGPAIYSMLPVYTERDKWADLTTKSMLSLGCGILYKEGKAETRSWSPLCSQDWKIDILYLLFILLKLDNVIWN